MHVHARAQAGPPSSTTQGPQTCASVGPCVAVCLYVCAWVGAGAQQENTSLTAELCPPRGDTPIMFMYV